MSQEWKYIYTDEDESHCGYLVMKTGSNVPVAFIASANPNEEREAIARKVTAAPAMLEALELALTTIERLETKHGAFSSVQGTKDVINHAITQAKGQPTPD